MAHPHLVDESFEALPRRLRESLGVRIVSRALQVLCIVYGLFLVAWIWFTREVSAQIMLHDPVFYGYSLLVSGYVVSRFAIASLYRPARVDPGFRPRVSIVIPAFDEEDCISATIAACFAADWPADRLEIVVVDDGSTDGTWERMLAARGRHPGLVCVRFAHNRGKRAAMAEGIRRSTGSLCVFIDSDSIVERDALAHLAAGFADPRVGGVVGHAHVLNTSVGLIPKMQQVRYYVAFRILKGSESLFGAVTCASGCLAAYRRDALLRVLERWEHQTFMGRRATYGDDRALTNLVLRDWRIVYQSTAVCHTIVPPTLRRFLRQQMRWKRSWLRESVNLSRVIWRKNPVAALLTYASILCGWVSPVIVFRALVWQPLVESGDPTFYLIGVYAVTLLASLYYAAARRSPLWYHGVLYTLMYAGLLVWQLYIALATLRSTAWGTRASTHADAPGETVVVGGRAEESREAVSEAA